MEFVNDWFVTAGHRIFGTNSSFHAGWRTAVGVKYLFSGVFVRVSKTFNLAGGLGTRLSFMGFRHSPDKSFFFLVWAQRPPKRRKCRDTPDKS